MQADPLITDALFEAFLHCRYKSYLRLEGIHGHITEFESHRRNLATAYADAAQSKHPGCALGEDTPVLPLLNLEDTTVRVSIT